jgi:hypothetical protein
MASSETTTDQNLLELQDRTHYGTKQAVAFNPISLNTNKSRAVAFNPISLNKSRWSVSEDDAKYKELMG